MEQTEHTFDDEYWETHWKQRNEGDQSAPSDGHENAETHREPNPYIAQETAELTPATALDAGCGTGAEAILLAQQGWNVTGADLSRTALDIARERATDGLEIEWVQADLTTWEPGRQWDLVVTNYAHPTIPQLDFYTHLASWVAPGGRLLIVAHGENHPHHHDQHDQHRHHHQQSEVTEFPPEATVGVGDVVAKLEAAGMVIETARENMRSFGSGEQAMTFHDVIVRARK